jgi:hypothetical protein
MRGESASRDPSLGSARPRRCYILRLRYLTPSAVEPSGLSIIRFVLPLHSHPASAPSAGESTGHTDRCAPPPRSRAATSSQAVSFWILGRKRRSPDPRPQLWCSSEAGGLSSVVGVLLSLRMRQPRYRSSSLATGRGWADELASHVTGRAQFSITPARRVVQCWPVGQARCRLGSAPLRCAHACSGFRDRCRLSGRV